jgi:AcrR family transcriptional regulator
MPRNSFAQARKTRSAIVDRAVDVASLEGLEGLTFGRLAKDVEMSKAGLVGHFGTKEELQLAALDEAIDRFRAAVPGRAENAPHGLPRLLAICDAWTQYPQNTFQGGCFLTAASYEFDDRPGPVRDRVVDALAQWSEFLTREAATAIEAGDLPSDADPEQIAYELAALAAGRNHVMGSKSFEESGARTLRAMHRVLGVGAG